MRSYLGFDARPVQVTGAVRSYDLAPYYSRLAGNADAREETQEHGIIGFDDGRLGIFHWTSVGYDSPLRWWRSSRFLAEKGMGITVGVGLEVEERLSAAGARRRGAALYHASSGAGSGSTAARWRRCVAHTGDPDQPIVRWDNPFLSAIPGASPQWHDDEIGVAGCIMSLVNAVRTGVEPSYGALQGRLDQEIILAIRQSSDAGGQPVPLPLAAS